MAWYDEAIFYHIYPLGLANAPKQNEYKEPEHRLNDLIPWIKHIREIGCNALYIGPLFESVGHGYETTDYKKLDSRLGTNEDLKKYVKECHKQGIRVIFDGVFNHTGRDFFAFKDIQKNRENSQYKDWYCNVNFYGNNEYNDGFSYDNWGGYNLLVKLNQQNPAVQDYICDVIRYWVSEFDVDGIRLDAADVLDFGFMQQLRRVANEVKPEFWLMGEVIHGDYNRWVNEGTLHSVTNYQLHKALFSGHNDHNYFEIAHTVRRLYSMGGNSPEGLKLYNFVDNHDVERIYTKLNNKAQFSPVHVLLYTLPGIPSIYYGSEFGIEGRKEKSSDDSLRPAINLDDYKDAIKKNSCTSLVAALGKIRQNVKALSYGDYQERLLTNEQYAFARNLDGDTVVITVNNADHEADITVGAGNADEYYGALTGQRVKVENGCINIKLEANSGEIWLPDYMKIADLKPVAVKAAKKVAVKKSEGRQESESENKNYAKPDVKSGYESDNNAKSENKVYNKSNEQPVKMNKDKTEADSGNLNSNKIDVVEVDMSKSYEDMTVTELQNVILGKLASNGPVTDQMKKDVAENIYHDSLVNWAKSFR